MPGRIATVDTSVLLSLQCTQMIAPASVLFTRLLVPAAVRREIAADRERNAAVLQALRDFELFADCDDYDPASVDILLQQRKFQKAGRDRGEAEAVVQASQRGAQMVLVDDALGRKWAASRTLEVHGTLWIFEQLRIPSYIATLRPHFEELLKNRRRQPLPAMNELLRRYAEPEFSAEEARDLSATA